MILHTYLSLVCMYILFLFFKLQEIFDLNSSQKTVTLKSIWKRDCYIEL